MSFQTEEIFKLPFVYKARVRLDERASIQTEIKTAYENCEIDYLNTWGKTQKLSTKTFTEDFIEDHKLNSVSNALNKHVSIYAEMLGLSTNVRKRTSWLTQYDKGDYAHIHNHGAADISGCYYYQTCGSDGTFFFSAPVRELQIFNYPKMQDRAYISPEVGMILLFPGWYPHGVTTNETDKSRIAIGFNYDLG